MSLRIRDEQLVVLEEGLVADRLLAYVTWMRDALHVPLPTDASDALAEALAHARALRAAGITDHRTLVEHVGRALVDDRIGAGWDPATARLDGEVAHGA